jgi:hypothetical protein
MDRSDENSSGGLTPTHGVWLVIGSALAGLVVLGVIFRKTKSSD